MFAKGDGNTLGLRIKLIDSSFTEFRYICRISRLYNKYRKGECCYERERFYYGLNSAYPRYWEPYRISRISRKKFVEIKAITQLRYAIKENNHSKAKKILDKYPEILNHQFKVKVIPDEKKDFLFGFQFIESAKYGYLEMVKLLISKGININQKDDYGNTALSKAKKHNHQEIVDFLISHGATE